MDDKLEGHFQALRSVYKRSSATLASELPESEIVHIDIHQDPTGKDIVLWEEILGAFKCADNVRHKTRVLPFLKDERFNTLMPLRIAAMPKTVLDVYILPVDTNSHSSVSTNTPDPTSPAVDCITDVMAKAERGDMNAQVELGDAYETGKGVTEDYISAIKYFRRAANRGHAMAQYRMGLLYKHGRGVEKNPYRADSWFEKADKQDLPQAQYQLGLARMLSKNYSSAMTYFIKAAKHGHAESEVHIARFFLNGQGVPQDFEKAIEWFRKAMEDDSGDDIAPFELGQIYCRGYGVPLDFPKAEECFVKAGNLGNVNAQRNLGVMYRDGRQGVAQDSVRAMEWLLKAADQNDKESQCTVGAMYDNGEGVVRDTSKAMEWYLKAADQKYAEASCCIGELYYDGWGSLPRDLAKAKEWFEKAAQEGHFEANEYVVQCGGQRKVFV
ncbi:hypothetical protein BGZ89_012534 [Linnemannia elongata]|nr:hypothetical protein BGZ89_012534 [Linnemannia elongata]